MEDRIHSAVFWILFFLGTACRIHGYITAAEFFYAVDIGWAARGLVPSVIKLWRLKHER